MREGSNSSQYVLNDDLRDEIYRLLEQAKSHDPRYKQFGASAHKYILNPPLDHKRLHAIEAKYEITLPEEFSWFMTEVGNGGAGPNLGINAFPPGDATFHERVFVSYEKAKYDAPDLPLDNGICFDDPSEWRGIVELAPLPPLKNDEYDDMQPGLVVTGQNRGRVVDIDTMGNYSQFPLDNSSFLEWYMDWLHEAAAGYDIGWFGGFIEPGTWVKLGTPEQIMVGYDDSDDTDRRIRLLSLQKTIKDEDHLPEQGPGLSPKIQQQVIFIYHDDPSECCRIEALSTMIHCEIPGWVDATEDKLRDQDWAYDITQTLSRKYKRYVPAGHIFRPDVRTWFASLCHEQARDRVDSNDTGGLGSMVR